MFFVVIKHVMHQHECFNVIAQVVDRKKSTTVDGSPCGRGVASVRGIPIKWRRVNMSWLHLRSALYNSVDFVVSFSCSSTKTRSLRITLRVLCRATCWKSYEFGSV